MKEKLLDYSKDNSVESVIEKINNVVKNEFSVLKLNDDIEKWNSIPKLLMLDDVAQKRLMSFIEFMDSLDIEIEKKLINFISLSSILEISNIKLYDYDNGNLFTLADYYKNRTIVDIKNTISIISNKELLLAVRTKTLDLDDRIKILLSIEKKLINDKIDTANLDSVSEFITNIVNEIETKTESELINK